MLEVVLLAEFVALLPLVLLVAVVVLVAVLLVVVVVMMLLRNHNLLQTRPLICTCQKEIIETRRLDYKTEAGVGGVKGGGGLRVRPGVCGVGGSFACHTFA